MSLTVKAILNRDEPEIRRFPIPTDVSSSFEYLKKKISEIFPSLRQGNFKLYWKGIFKNNVTVFIRLGTTPDMRDSLAFPFQSMLKC